jgi:CheY-like chemotaxis protein
LLFTDVVMPEMNGRLLADEARKLRPDLKVLLFATGYTRKPSSHGTL